MREAFRVFAVQGLYADVALWESHISEWSATYAEGLAIKADGRTGIG